MAKYIIFLGLILSMPSAWAKDGQSQPIMFTDSTIVQVAMVVRDVETTARNYSTLFGVEMPPIIMSDPDGSQMIKEPNRLTVTNTFRGGESDGRAKLAFFRMPNIMIELIEPVGGASTWREFLETHGEGIHHIAVMVEGIDEYIGRLEGDGAELVQRGEHPDGRYAYIDARGQLGAIVELLEARQ